MNTIDTAVNQLYDNPRFPFVMFTVNANSCTPPGPGYQYLHWHEDLQFTVVTKGTVSMMVNGTNYDLKEKEGIFINSSLLHMTNHISKDGEYISFNFPTRLLSILYGSIMETEYVQYFTLNYNLPAILLSLDIEWQRDLIRLLLDLKDFTLRQDVYAKEYEISLQLLNIWLSFIRNVRTKAKGNSKSYIHKQQLMQLMLTFIHEHYPNEIRLNDIAFQANISCAECNRIFQKMLNTTPYEYLLNYRMNKAIDLLTTSNNQVSTIATLVGFNDSSHFIQLFKKHTGKTPSQLRLNYEKGQFSVN